jgi:hypothetical protein
VLEGFQGVMHGVRDNCWAHTKCGKFGKAGDGHRAWWSFVVAGAKYMIYRHILHSAHIPRLVENMIIFTRPGRRQNPATHPRRAPRVE